MFAANTNIDFAFLPGNVPTSPGQSITNEYAAWGVTFATETNSVLYNAAITGYNCCGTPTYGALTDSTDGAASRQAALDFFFTSPVTLNSFDFDDYGTDLSTAYIYGPGHILLTTFSLPQNGLTMSTVSVGLSGVSEVQLVAPYQGWLFAVNNVNYNATPEPGTLTLLLPAVGALGVLRRKFFS
jgi:hypothetical protein